MLPIRKIIAMLFCCFVCGSAFSQSADSAATVKLIAKTWTPDSVIVNNQKQDGSKSDGAKMSLNKDLTITSTNPDGTEDQGSWKYDVASNSIIMKQSGEEEPATFKIISVSEKIMVLSMVVEGLPGGVTIYFSPVKE